MAAEKARQRREFSTELPEPDLLPMMNICFMLILALMTMAAFVPLGFITAESPKLSSAVASNQPQKPELNLTIMVAANGFDIGMSGKVLNGAAEGRAGQALIPKISRGSEMVYDFEKLGQKMAEIKDQHPTERRIFLMAHADVIYDDIIHTLDATREREGKLLFPDVAFGVGVLP